MELRCNTHWVRRAGQLAVGVAQGNIASEGIGHLRDFIGVTGQAVSEGCDLPKRVGDRVDAIATVVMNRCRATKRINNLRHEYETRICGSAVGLREHLLRAIAKAFFVAVCARPY